MKSIDSLALALMVALPVIGGCDSSSGTSAKKSYVLVHGAWMGAWCWDDVAAGLRANGDTVATVELPAHGSDQTPVSGATLEAYVAKVTTAIDAAPQPVILVGHSMGGVVVTQVAETAGAKIGRLVYIGAYMPEDGQTLNDLASTDTASHLGPVLQIDQVDGVAHIPSEDLEDIFIADGTASEIASVMSNYRDEPLAPFLTPVHTTASGWGAVSKAYVYTEEDHAVSPALQQTMTAGVTLATTATLDTSHAPFLSRPDLVISTLQAM